MIFDQNFWGSFPLLLPLLLMGLVALILVLNMAIQAIKSLQSLILLTVCPIVVLALFSFSQPAIAARFTSGALNFLVEECYPIFVDSLATGWCVLSLVLVFMILTWPRESLTGVASGASASTSSPGTNRREILGGLWLTACTQLTASSTQVWYQWASMVLTGWGFCLVLGRDIKNRERTGIATSTLLWFTISDLVWLAGLSLLTIVFPQLNLAHFAAADSLNLMQSKIYQSAETALVVTALFFLLISLLIRCGLYPFMSWAGAAAMTYRDAAWVIGFGIGPAMILVMRWGPLLSTFAETQLLLAGGAILSSSLLALMALMGTRGPTRLVYAAASQLGVIWIGVAADPVEMGLHMSMALSLIWVFAATGIALSGGSRDGKLSVNSTWIVATVAGFAGLAMLGVLGQERIFESIRAGGNLTGPHAWLALAGLIFSQILVSWTLFRDAFSSPALMLQPSPRSLPVSIHGPTALHYLGLQMLTGTCLIFVAAQAGYFVTGQIEVLPPLVCGTAMLIGLVAARMWPALPISGYQPAPDRWESLRRMARAEFYAPAMIQLCLLVPVRAASQISRFLEWIVIGALVQKLPTNLLLSLSERAASADEEARDTDRAWHLATATAVMLAGVAAGVWLQ